MPAIIRLRTSVDTISIPPRPSKQRAEPTLRFEIVVAFLKRPFFKEHGFLIPDEPHDGETPPVMSGAGLAF